jgi:hypothetical protein
VVNRLCLTTSLKGGKGNCLDPGTSLVKDAATELDDQAATCVDTVVEVKVSEHPDMVTGSEAIWRRTHGDVCNSPE